MTKLRIVGVSIWERVRLENNISQLEGGWRGRGGSVYKAYAIFKPNPLPHGYPNYSQFSHYLPTCLWRWNRQSVPKRRHVKFRRRGITQKKTYSIQNTAKVWNQEFCMLFVFYHARIISGEFGLVRQTWTLVVDFFFYLWVMSKDGVSINNPWTVEELKISVRDVEPSVSAAERRRAMNRLYMTHVCSSKETFFITFSMYTLVWLD